MRALALGEIVKWYNSLAPEQEVLGSIPSLILAFHSQLKTLQYH